MAQVLATEVVVPFIKPLPGELTSGEHFTSVNIRNDIEIAKFINARAGRTLSTEGKRATLLMQAKLIQSELNEFIKAVEAGDVLAARDAAADILVCGNGINGVWDIPLAEDYRRCAASNLTRIDTNMEDAEITRNLWIERGVNCVITETVVHNESFFPVTVDMGGPYYWNGDDFPVGKFLKSHKFTQPTYRDIPELKIVD